MAVLLANQNKTLQILRKKVLAVDDNGNEHVFAGVRMLAREFNIAHSRVGYAIKRGTPLLHFKSLSYV